MSFFKKAGKSISSAFKKAPSVVSNIFKKTGDISRGISSGLDRVGDVLGKVGSVVNSPIAQGIASSLLGPEAGVALGELGSGIRQAKQISRMGSGLAGSASGISKDLAKGKIMSGIQKVRELSGEPNTPAFM
jgi:hypothetical protein